MTWDFDDPRRAEPCTRYPVFAVGLPDTGGVWLSTGDRSTWADSEIAHVVIDKDSTQGMQNRLFTLYVQPTPHPPATCGADPHTSDDDRGNAPEPGPYADPLLTECEPCTCPREYAYVETCRYAFHARLARLRAGA